MNLLSVLKPICVAVVLASAVACTLSHNDDNGGGGGAAPATTVKAAEPQSVAPMTAQTAAEKINAAIPETTLITITGDNDANQMIGRSTRYEAATVIVDPRATGTCDQNKPGIVCWAGIKQWPDAAAAQQRAHYLKGVMNAMPMLGTEYATLRGNLLLRVDGNMTPAVADQYRAAFTG